MIRRQKQNQHKMTRFANDQENSEAEDDEYSSSLVESDISSSSNSEINLISNKLAQKRREEI